MTQEKKTDQAEWAWYVSFRGEVGQFQRHPGQGWSRLIEPYQLPENYNPEQGDIWTHSVPMPLGEPVLVPLRINAAGAWERDGDVLTLSQAMATYKEQGVTSIYGVENKDGQLRRLEKWT